MSTSAILTEQTSAALPVKKEVVTFAVVAVVENGKIVKKRHTSSENDIKDLERPDYGKDKDGNAIAKENEVIAFKQPVVKSKLGTLAGFEELVPDESVRLDIINKGLDAKFNQQIRTLLIETNEADTEFTFQPVEPTYDATDIYNKEPLRTTQSPMDKATKILAGLPPEMRAAILAQFAAQNVGE